MSKIWFLVVAVVVSLTVYYYATWQHWLSYATGSYNTPGVPHNYGAFSGSISDISLLTIAASFLASTAVIWRAHTCHRYWWCWHHGHFQVGDSPYKFCAKHHPDDVPTAKQAAESYTKTWVPDGN